MSQNTIQKYFGNKKVGINEKKTNVKITQNNIDTMKKENIEYIKTLTDKEYVAYEIAKNMLQTSFDLERSIGYKKWLCKK